MSKLQFVQLCVCRRRSFAVAVIVSPILSIAVAWILSLQHEVVFTPAPANATRLENAVWVMEDTSRSLGAFACVIRIDYPQGHPTSRPDDELPVAQRNRGKLPPLCVRLPQRRRAAETDVALVGREVCVAGWPVPCVAKWTDLWASVPVWPGDTQTGVVSGTLRLGVHELPARLLPLGMAVNSLAYTFLFLGSISMWRACTIARRISAGQCLQCGYSLRGGTPCCPECGTTMNTI